MIQDHFDVESWGQVAFGKVVQNKNENTSNPSLEGLSRVVGLDHMDSESLPLVRWSELGDLPDGTTFTRRFHAGQVLFGKRRSYQKKVSFPDFDGVCSGDILVFESLDSNRLLPGFLPLLVQSDPFMDFAISTSAGSLSPRTKWSDLSKFEFLLPSLKNQEEIIEIISSIDKATQGYENLSVRSYRQSIVHELLSSGAKEWTQSTIGEIAEVSYGYTESASETEIGPKFLRITDIQDGTVDWSQVPYCQIEEKQFEKQRLRNGDIVFARTGATTGKSFLLVNPPPAVCASYLIRLRPNQSLVIPNCLNLMFQTDQYWADIKAGMSGSAQGGFNASKLSSLSVSIPPIEEQKQIAETVSCVDLVVQSTMQAVTDLKALRSSILGEVFKDHSRA
jgi:type I restriction enzyme S subunit